MNLIEYNHENNFMLLEGNHTLNILRNKKKDNFL